MLNAVDVIFIDEVSMLRPDILDAMNWTLLKNGCEGLSHKQVVFVGDMFQLPSVIKPNERSVLYRTYDGDKFFDSKIYPKLNVVNIELTEVLRQSNEEFIQNLNIVRKGGKSEYFRKFVGTEPKGIILAPHNSTVEKYNREGLALNPNPEMKFIARVEGNIKAEDFNLQSEIVVKNGCKIMFLANNGDLVNGSLGIFTSFQDCHFIRVGNVDYAMNQMEFTKKEYVLEGDDLVLRELGKILQYPFRLAFALSIHKSQGLTFDEVTVDLTRPCFEKGQMYVALSRVTGPDGLRIIH